VLAKLSAAAAIRNEREKAILAERNRKPPFDNKAKVEKEKPTETGDRFASGAR
jgi:hypothetical protein